MFYSGRKSPSEIEQQIQTARLTWAYLIVVEQRKLSPDIQALRKIYLPKEKKSNVKNR